MNASGTPQDFWYTLPVTTSRQQFWQVWTDVTGWAKWDTPLKSASLVGAMELGARGQLTTQTGQTSAFVISEFTPLEAYTMTTALPLARLEVRRFFAQENGKLVFTHRVRFLGIGAPLFAALLGRGFMQQLPSVMQNLKNLAEAS
jgi:hypothetical protein